MKPKTRALLELCLENRVRRGWSRAYKHVESPSQEAIWIAIKDACMNEIYEWFTFEEEDL